MVTKGTAVTVGFGGYILAGTIAENAKPKLTADIKEIRGENNAVCTKLLSNPRSELTFVSIVTSHATYLAIKTGDTLTINSVAYMVVSSVPTKSREETTWDLELVKEDGMTYS